MPIPWRSAERLRIAERRHAGAALARQLQHFADRPDVMILALPRGGGPVGHDVARALGAPMDVFVVRKLGMPGGPPPVLFFRAIRSMPTSPRRGLIAGTRSDQHDAGNVMMSLDNALG